MGGKQSSSKGSQNKQAMAASFGGVGNLFKSPSPRTIDFKRWHKLMAKLKKIYTDNEAAGRKKGRQSEVPDWLGPVIKKYSEIKDSIEEYERKEVFTKNAQEQYVLETLVFENVVVQGEVLSARSLPGTPAKSSRTEVSTPFTITPAKSTRTDTSMSFLPEDNLLQSNKRLTNDSSHNNSKSSGIATSGSNPTSPTRMVEKELSSILGFQTKFITFSIENTSLQFSIALHAFLQKYFMSAIAEIETLLKQSQPGIGSRQDEFAEKCHFKALELLNNTRSFFEFMGSLAVEFYCLDALEFVGVNDMKFKVKISQCPLLSAALLGDYFTTVFFQKYIGPSLIDSLQRLSDAELTECSKKMFMWESLSRGELELPEEVFPDYQLLYKLVANRFKDKGVTDENLAPGASRQPGLSNVTQATDSSVAASEKPKSSESRSASSTRQRVDTPKKFTGLTERKNSTSTVLSTGAERREPDRVVGMGRNSENIPKVSSRSGLLKVHIGLGGNFPTDDAKGRSVGIRWTATQKCVCGVGRESGVFYVGERRSSRPPISSPSPLKMNRLTSDDGAEGWDGLLNNIYRLPEEKGLEFRQKVEVLRDHAPFQEAIVELKKIQFMERPIEKLRCVYNTFSLAICDIRAFLSVLAVDKPVRVQLTLENTLSALQIRSNCDSAASETLFSWELRQSESKVGFGVFKEPTRSGRSKVFQVIRAAVEFLSIGLRGEGVLLRSMAQCFPTLSPLLSNPSAAVRHCIVLNTLPALEPSSPADSLPGGLEYTLDWL